MEEAQHQEVSRKAMAFESISGSVVTEHTGDNQGEEGEYFTNAARSADDNAASSSVANSSNGDGSNKIREHDYIGLNSDSPSLAAVDKPEEERSSGGPDLNLGLGLSLSKNKDELLHCEDKDTGVFHRFKPPVSGSKRGYLEAVGIPDLSRNQLMPQMFPYPKPWRTIEQPRLDAAFNPFHGKPAAADKSINPAEEAPSSSPVVGWPPVQSFRKNTLVTSPPATKHREALGSSGDSQAAGAAASGSSLFVKVYMDGVPIGRKVDLDTNNSYCKLSFALKDMFSGFINGQNLPKLRPSLPTGEAQQQINLFDGHGAEYVLTYEDKDGDLMLVGDVPWRMFAATVKRLRIMKGSDAIGLGVPKDSELKARS